MRNKAPAGKGGQEIVQDVGALLPQVPGGVRGCAVEGVAGYLNIGLTPMRKLLSKRFDTGQEAQRRFPEAYMRLIRAVAEEAEKLKAEGVPPFDRKPD